MIIPDGVYDWQNSQGQSLWVHNVGEDTRLFFGKPESACVDEETKPRQIYLIVLRNTCFPGEIYNFQWIYKDFVDSNPPKLEQAAPFQRNLSTSTVTSPLYANCICCDPYFSFENTSKVNEKDFTTHIINPPIEIKPSPTLPKGFISDKTKYLFSQPVEYWMQHIKSPCTVPWPDYSPQNAEMFTLLWKLDLNDGYKSALEEYYHIQPPLCLDAPTIYWRYFEANGECTQTRCSTEPDETCQYKDMCECLEDNGIHNNPYCLALKKKTVMPWWAWLLLSIALIGIIIGITVPLSLKKKKTRRR